MKEKERTDQDIILRIQDESTRDNTLYYLYKQLDWQGAAIAFVKKNGGSEEEASEVAQNTMIIFYQNILGNKFKGESALKSYFLGIAKLQWFKQLKRNKKNVSFELENYDAAEESPEIIYINEEKKQCFYAAISQISERCQKILEFNMLKTSMADIALIMGFSSAEMAKKEASRCRIRFRDFLLAHPAWLKRIK